MTMDGLGMPPKLKRTTKGGVDGLWEVGGSVGGPSSLLVCTMVENETDGHFRRFWTFGTHIQGTIPGTASNDPGQKEQ